MVQAFWKTVWQFFTKLNIFSPYNPTTEFVILYRYIFIFHCKIIVLQYCIVFCHISICITHRYMYIPTLLNLLSTPDPIPVFSILIVEAPLIFLLEFWPYSLCLWYCSFIWLGFFFFFAYLNKYLISLLVFWRQ